MADSNADEMCDITSKRNLAFYASAVDGHRTPDASGDRLRHAVEVILCGTTEIREERKIRDLRVAVRYAVGDAFDLFHKIFASEKGAAEGGALLNHGGEKAPSVSASETAQQQVTDMLHRMISKEVRSQAESENRLRKAEAQIDFMVKQLERREVLAAEQRVELLRQITTQSDQILTVRQKHQELLEQYRSLQRRFVVGALAGGAKGRKSTSSMGGLAASQTLAFGSSEESVSLQSSASVVMPPPDGSTYPDPQPLQPSQSVDIPLLTNQLETQWLSLVKEEEFVAREKDLKYEAEQKLKALRIKLLREKETTTQKTSRRMEDILKVEATKHLNRIRQLEYQLQLKETETEQNLRNERERMKVQAQKASDGAQQLHRQREATLRQQWEASRMEAADLASNVSQRLPVLVKERDAARMSVGKLSKEVDLLRQEVIREKDKRKAGGTSASSTTAKTIESLRAAVQKLQDELEGKDKLLKDRESELDKVRAGLSTATKEVEGLKAEATLRALEDGDLEATHTFGGVRSTSPGSQGATKKAPQKSRAAIGRALEEATRKHKDELSKRDEQLDAARRRALALEQQVATQAEKMASIEAEMETAKAAYQKQQQQQQQPPSVAPQNPQQTQNKDATSTDAPVTAPLPVAESGTKVADTVEMRLAALQSTVDGQQITIADLTRQLAVAENDGAQLRQELAKLNAGRFASAPSSASETWPNQNSAPYEQIVPALAASLSVRSPRAQLIHTESSSFAVLPLTAPTQQAARTTHFGATVESPTLGHPQRDVACQSEGTLVDAMAATALRTRTVQTDVLGHEAASMILPPTTADTVESQENSRSAATRTTHPLVQPTVTEVTVPTVAPVSPSTKHVRLVEPSPMPPLPAQKSLVDPRVKFSSDFKAVPLRCTASPEGRPSNMSPSRVYVACDTNRVIPSQLYSRTMDDVVAEAQVALDVVADESLQRAMCGVKLTPSTAAESMVKHAIAKATHDVRLSERSTGSQTDSVAFVRLPAGHAFPRACYKQHGGPLCSQVSPQTIMQASRHCVVLVCAPFEYTSPCATQISLAVAPFVYDEELVIESTASSISRSSNAMMMEFTKSAIGLALHSIRRSSPLRKLYFGASLPQVSPTKCPDRPEDVDVPLARMRFEPCPHPATNLSARFPAQPTIVAIPPVEAPMIITRIPPKLKDSCNPYSAKAPGSSSPRPLSASSTLRARKGDQRTLTEAPPLLRAVGNTVSQSKRITVARPQTARPVRPPRPPALAE